jgi:hypothetical protein
VSRTTDHVSRVSKKAVKKVGGVVRKTPQHIADLFQNAKDKYATPVLPCTLLVVAASFCSACMLLFCFQLDVPAHLWWPVLTGDASAVSKSTVGCCRRVSTSSSPREARTALLELEDIEMEASDGSGSTRASTSHAALNLSAPAPSDC